MTKLLTYCCTRQYSLTVKCFNSPEISTVCTRIEGVKGAKSLLDGELDWISLEHS